MSVDRLEVVLRPPVPHPNATPAEAKEYITQFRLSQDEQLTRIEVEQAASLTIVDGKNLYELSLEELEVIHGELGIHLYNALTYGDYGYVSRSFSFLQV